MPTHWVRILVAKQPVDFRKGHDGLAALVQSVLREDPFTGSLDLLGMRGKGDWTGARLDGGCIDRVRRGRSV
jgi:hypothetical protein